MKKKLSEVDIFFIKAHAKEDVNIIAQKVGCDIASVKEILKEVEESENPEPKTRKKTRLEGLYGNNGKGAIVATEAASQYSDATRQKSKPDNSGFIHKIK